MMDTNNLDLSKLTPRDKQELQQFLTHESQKSMIQASVHNLTEICWKKCVTGSIRSAALDKPEQTCAQSCVERFMDANAAIIKHLQSMRNQS